MAAKFSMKKALDGHQVCTQDGRMVYKLRRVQPGETENPAYKLLGVISGENQPSTWTATGKYVACSSCALGSDLRLVDTLTIPTIPSNLRKKLKRLQKQAEDLAAELGRLADQ